MQKYPDYKYRPRRRKAKFKVPHDDNRTAYDFGEIEGVVLNSGHLTPPASPVPSHPKMVIPFSVSEEMSFDHTMTDATLNFREYPDTPPYYNRFKGFDFSDGCSNTRVEMCHYLQERPLTFLHGAMSSAIQCPELETPENYVLSSQELRDVTEIDSTEFDQYLKADDNVKCTTETWYLESWLPLPPPPQKRNKTHTHFFPKFYVITYIVYYSYGSKSYITKWYLDNTRWNDFSLIFVLCPKWQFKMKNTGFGKARFTLYDIFNPKEFISYERSQGLRIVILSRFTIIYPYFMNSMYSACHSYLLKSLCCLRIAYFLFELNGRLSLKLFI